MAMQSGEWSAAANEVQRVPVRPQRSARLPQSDACDCDNWTRQERAAVVRNSAVREVPDKQRAFIDFVLAQHEVQGVDELGQENLPPLLSLRYKRWMTPSWVLRGLKRSGESS